MILHLKRDLIPYLDIVHVLKTNICLLFVCIGKYLAVMGDDNDSICIVPREKANIKSSIFCFRSSKVRLENVLLYFQNTEFVGKHLRSNLCINTEVKVLGL